MLTFALCCIVIGLVLQVGQARSRAGKARQAWVSGNTSARSSTESGPKWDQDVPYALSVDYDSEMDREDDW